MIETIKAWLIFDAAMPYLVPIVLVALFIYYVTKGVAQAVSGQKISEINGVEVDKEKINSIQKKLKKRMGK